MIVLITVPLMVLFIFVQRYLVVGFGAGAVRG
jgi:ABC-type maltose transport system permease subunit